jgi:peroxiredoxin Q/BCP
MPHAREDFTADILPPGAAEPAVTGTPAPSRAADALPGLLRAAGACPVYPRRLDHRELASPTNSVGPANRMDGEESTMAKLAAGDTAPAFTLLDEDANKVSLSDFVGRQVVVYFYPRDDTPGCTKEACQFNDLLGEFGAAGADVLGISPDGGESHRRFRKRYGLNVRLLSDPDHAVMEPYGAWGEKTLYGKTSMGVIRSTFLVDASGRIAKAWYHVRADGHAAKVLAEIGA